MLYLLLAVGFKGLQVLLAKMAVSQQFYVYVSAGASLTWVAFIVGYAIHQLAEVPYDVKWPEGYLMIGAIGLVAAVADLMAYRALSVLPASLVSVAMISYPVVTIGLAIWWFDERLTLLQWLGLPFIGFGMFLLLYFRSEVT